MYATGLGDQLLQLSPVMGPLWLLTGVAVISYTACVGLVLWLVTGQRSRPLPVVIGSAVGVLGALALTFAILAAAFAAGDGTTPSAVLSSSVGLWLPLVAVIVQVAGCGWLVLAARDRAVGDPGKARLYAALAISVAGTFAFVAYRIISPAAAVSLAAPQVFAVPVWLASVAGSRAAIHLMRQVPVRRAASGQAVTSAL
jgi:hypothetical protein